MKKTIGAIILSLLMILLLANAAAAEGIAFSDNTIQELDKLENGPIYLPVGPFRNSYSYSVSLASDMALESVTFDWVSGDEALRDYFNVWQNNNGNYLLQTKSTWSQTGQATFLLTAKAENGETLTRNMNITISELSYSALPAVLRPTVEATQYEKLNVSDAGILSNPDGFPVRYMISGDNGGYYSFHSYQDADGQRFEFGTQYEKTTFTAEETGTYKVRAMVLAGQNLISSYDFEIVVGSGEAGLDFSSKTKQWLDKIEAGPIYLPTDDFTNSGAYDISLNKGDVDSLELVFVEGEPLLRNMFVTGHPGQWYLYYADTFGGTGSARFKLIAHSGEETVEREFTATVSEADTALMPSQLKTTVAAQVNVPLYLTDAGIVDNPAHYQESYRMKDGDNWVYSHTAQDADGQRYTFGNNGKTTYAFTGQEAGTYPALVRVNFGINLLSTFYFDVVAEDTGVEADAVPLYDYTEEFIRKIESGAVYVTQPGYDGTGVSIVATQNCRPSTSAQVTLLEGDQQLKDILEISKIGNGYYMGFSDNITATGAAVFRLTVTSDEGTATRDFSVTVTEPDLSKEPQQALTEVKVKTGVPATMETMGVLNNPGGFEEDFFITKDENTYYYHDYADKDGERFSIGHDRDVRTFVAYEPGVYNAVAEGEFGLNMQKQFPFTIVAEDADETLDISLQYSSDFLYSLKKLEEGPIYLPVGAFSGDVYVYNISLEGDETVDSASVKWISGDETLKNLFETYYSNGRNRWMMGYDEYAGTGTATFQVTAVSGEKAAREEFTVTVEALKTGSEPVQQKNSVVIPMGQEAALNTLGIISNPEGYEEVYMVRGENGSSSYHAYEDVDGGRYQLNNGYFKGGEIATYSAFMQVKPSYNLTASFYFSITVISEPDYVLAPSGIGSVRTLTCGGAAAWSSSDPSVATVENGKVTARGQGIAMINALDTDGNRLDFFFVMVREMDTFTLPGGITTLDAEALAGTAAERIILPSGITEIAPDAFANMPNLQVVYIPSGALINGLELNGDTVIYTDAAVSGFDYPIEVQ